MRMCRRDFISIGLMRRVVGKHWETVHAAEEDDPAEVGRY